MSWTAAEPRSRSCPR